MRIYVFTLSLISSSFFSFSANVLRVVLSDEDSNCESIIRLHPNATSNYDSQLDAYYLSAGEDLEICSLSSDNKELVINSFNESEYNVIPLITSDLSNKDELSLNFVGIDSFEEDVEVLLQDTENGEIVDLKSIDTYSFSPSEIVDNKKSRFQLIMHKTSVITALSNFKPKAEVQAIDDNEQVEFKYKDYGAYISFTINKKCKQIRCEAIDINGNLIAQQLTTEKMFEIESSATGFIIINLFIDEERHLLKLWR